MAGKGKAASKAPAGKSATESTSQKSPARTKSPGKKSSERPKSPKRPKSPGRPKSPARTKSETKTRLPTPSRTTRLKSPARVKNASPPPKTSTPIQVTLKSPSRKSPSRHTKEKDIQPKKQKRIIDTDTDSDNAGSIPKIKEKPKATVRGRTRRTDLDLADEDMKKSDDGESIGALGLIRRFTRSSQNKDVEKMVHLKHFDSITVSKRLGEFSSDDDELIDEKSLREFKKHAVSEKIVEFGGLYGALILIIVIPLTVLTLYTFCTKASCSVKSLPNLGSLKSISTYFDAKSYLGVSAYFTLLAILTAIPAGGAKISGPPNLYGRFDYVLNGLISFVILLFIFAGLQFKNIDVAAYLVKYIFQILFGSILLGIIVSVLSYIRSFYVPVIALNTYAVGKGGLFGFFVGRELNPRLFSVVDLKLLFFRASLIATIFIDLAYLSTSLDPEFKIDHSDSTFTITPKILSVQPTILVFTILHTYYFLDSLVFESSWLTAFTHQQEGFGYLLALSYCTSPFFNALLVKYVVENNVELATWKLVLAVLVYFIGFIIYRRSNNQKDAFRKDPYSPAFINAETIPTSQGKKLLTSGLWGKIRHPNYVGDIIIRLAWVPFVLSTIPILSIALTVLILVHRSLRDDKRCKQKYGDVWDRYRNRVRYALLPRVY